MILEHYQGEKLIQTGVLELNGNLTQQLQVDSSYKYLTVFNNSSYSINIYNGLDTGNQNLLASLPSGFYTIPIPEKFREPVNNLTIVATGSGNAVVPYQFSNQNPNINVYF